MSDVDTKKQYILKRLKEKIDEYKLKEDVNKIPLSGQYVETKYNDGTSEIIDPIAEFYLCKKHFVYFADKYGFILDSLNKRISPLKLFDFQKNLIIPVLLNNRFVIFRKCLTENNYVQTDRGFISIKDVKIGDKILTLKDGKQYWDEVVDWWKNEDLKETIKFTLKDGSEHESTLDHKWLTTNGWKEAKDLTTSDELITNFKDNKFGNHSLSDPKLAKLFGYILTDGRRGSEFINTNELYINEALSIAKIIAPESYVKTRNKSKPHYKQSYEVRIINSPEWKKLVKKYELNKKGIDKKLAPELMNLNKNETSLLLNALYAGDGWATYGWRENPDGLKAAKFSIGFVSPSKTMIYQVQELLRKYGIKSYIKTRLAGRKKATINSYTLHVTGKESALIFAREIGIFNKIGDDFVSFVESNFKNESKQSNSKIRKIVNTGLKQTYDITTRDTHTFLTNGAVAHNCRQVGASVVAGVYALWKANFNIAQDIIIISKTRPDAQDFKAKAIVTYDRLPNFLKTKATRDGQNMTTLKLSNNSRIVVRAQSPDAGRGGSWALVILDEAAFMPYADDIWSAVFPALSTSGGQCFIISTSNGVGNFYHKTWIAAEQDENDFKPLYIPWWKFPNRDNPWLTEIEKRNVTWIEGQLGEKTVSEIKRKILSTDKNEKEIYWTMLVDAFIKVKQEEALAYDGPKENKPWLKSQLDNASSPRKFYQETLAEFLGSGNTVISSDALKKIEMQIRDPIHKDELSNKEYIKNLHVFENPIDDMTYTALVDVATGAGEDYNTIQIVRDDTLEQVAEYKDQIDTKNFAKIIKQCARHYNHAYVIIETNQGMSVFNDVFLHETDPYQNVFYEYKNKTYRGLHTGPANKKLMLDEFCYALENNVIKVYGRRTLEELKVYIWQNGRPEATRGYNDDLVLPLLFLAYVIKYGNQKTKILGFATQNQMLGNEPGDEFEQSEMQYLKEQTAIRQVEEQFGIDWETYQWLVK